MSEQANRLPFPHLLLNGLFRRKLSNSREHSQFGTLPQRPLADDFDAWRIYWRMQGQSWRIEPEITEERQRYLSERNTIRPDLKKGIYPFKDIKLSRADIEWLLSTHDNGKGPVVWSDESQRDRNSLDLRGADLRQVNLSDLPLSRLRGGLNREERTYATAQQCEMAAVHLEGAFLIGVHLERADLFRAHLEETNLFRAHLEKTFLREAHLERADLNGGHLERIFLREANLKGANLRRVQLERAELRDIILSDEKHIGPLVADAQWGNVDLTSINWSQIDILADENEARQKMYNGRIKDKVTRLKEYELAVRANRQLSVALQAQGLNEDAARFAYRAQRLQCSLLRRQKKFGRYIFYLFLDLLAGYGYKPIRSFICYLVVIFTFTILFGALGHQPPQEAIILSLTSFHGRGFLPNNPSSTIALSNPTVVLASIEAVLGLFIEISFIATFTQRFFGK
jgi:uncharacterized protein YjbI with pentapeptide repeats